MCPARAVCGVYSARAVCGVCSAKAVWCVLYVQVHCTRVLYLGNYLLFAFGRSSCLVYLGNYLLFAFFRNSCVGYLGNSTTCCVRLAGAAACLVHRGSCSVFDAGAKKIKKKSSSQTVGCHCVPQVGKGKQFSDRGLSLCATGWQRQAVLRAQGLPGQRLAGTCTWLGCCKRG